MEPDDRSVAGHAALAHLQTAALEVIAALRATLDVAEDLVKDQSLAAAGDTVAGVISRVVEAVEPLLATRPARPARPPNDGEDGDDHGGTVEHIRVS